jgi:hypothetical protein
MVPSVVARGHNHHRVQLTFYTIYVSEPGQERRNTSMASNLTHGFPDAALTSMRLETAKAAGFDIARPDYIKAAHKSYTGQVFREELLPVLTVMASKLCVQDASTIFNRTLRAPAQDYKAIRPAIITSTDIRRALEEAADPHDDEQDLSKTPGTSLVDCCTGAHCSPSVAVETHDITHNLTSSCYRFQ